MKRILCGIAFLAIGPVGHAYAADMPVKVSPAPAPVPSWTGCYVGIHVGAGMLSDYFFSDNGPGAIGGGQLGCNYQTGNLMFGVEGEGWVSSIRANEIADDSTFNSRAAASNRWTADLALRGGVSVDGTLVYGKFGVAEGDSTSQEAIRSAISPGTTRRSPASWLEQGWNIPSAPT